ncbi:MAG: response regulator [Ardenticatenaceae bacterium]|nr:response regulator [Ardenticatenaceae bacterium]
MSDDKKQILIIEDDPNLITMLQEYFHMYAEYEIVAASTGEEGLTLAGELQPDLILQDIRLPDIDGFEVCRRLRSGGRNTENIPLIFLTEKQERKDRLAGLELGAVDYITKPFDMQELRLRVRNILNRTSFVSLVNAVTNLPEGEVVKENLNQMLKQDDWGIVLAGLRGLYKFRDQYGFVASDDVARATGIMLSGALRAVAGREAFLGHLDTADFVAIVAAGQAEPLARRYEKQLTTALPQFYPAIDRESATAMRAPDRLAYQITTLTSKDGIFRSIEDLRQALLEFDKS